MDKKTEIGIMLTVTVVCTLLATILLTGWIKEGNIKHNCELFNAVELRDIVYTCHKKESQ